jgi:hypothetical protein
MRSFKKNLKKFTQQNKLRSEGFDGANLLNPREKSLIDKIDRQLLQVITSPEIEKFELTLAENV